MAGDTRKYDIYVTMEADAVDTGKQININNSPIRVGDSDAVRSKGLAGYGFCHTAERKRVVKKYFRKEDRDYEEKEYICKRWKIIWKNQYY